MAGNRITVLEVLEAGAGGTLVHLLQIAEHIDKAEFEVTAAVSTGRMHEPDRVLARLRELGARVEVVPMVRRVAPLADLRALARLTRLMRRERFDVVHAHSSKAGFLARLAARRAGVKRVFYTPHAFAFQRGGAPGWLYLRLERLAARFGGVILAVSEGERLLAVQNAIVTPERVLVVPNAIETPERPTPAERRAARVALGLPENAAVVGTVGRAEPQKGYEYLIRAAGRVCRSREDARFVLIGGGRLLPELRRLAALAGVADRVVFAGERADAVSLTAAFDTYVQPSLWEGLSYSLLEAMGRGLPVVATRVPGNTDLVEHGTTGLLVPARDPSALADAILRLLADAPARAAFGEAARQRILRDHRLPDFIRSIEALYRGGSA